MHYPHSLSSFGALPKWNNLLVIPMKHNVENFISPFTYLIVIWFRIFVSLCFNYLSSPLSDMVHFSGTCSYISSDKR